MSGIGVASLIRVPAKIDSVLFTWNRQNCGVLYYRNSL